MKRWGGLSLLFSLLVALPADDEVPHAVWSYSATWAFETIDDLDAFSRHPSIHRFVHEWVKPLGLEIAFANCGTSGSWPAGVASR